MAHLEVTDRLGEHAPAWDALVAAADPPNAMWRSWALVAREEPDLRYLLVVDEGRLLGGLTVTVRATRRFAIPVVTLPAAAASHADLLAVPGKEQEVADHVAGWFRSHRNAIIDLWGLVPSGRLPGVVGATPTLSQVGHSPYVSLPDDFEHYLATRSANFRSNLRRNRRRLQQAGFRHRVLHADETDRALSELHRLHAQRHGERSTFLPRFEAFSRVARAGVAVGELTFHALERDADIIAIDAVFEVAGRADYYQGGRDTVTREHQGAGLVLLAEIVATGSQRGLRELDLQPQADAYKLGFTEQLRPVSRLHATRGWAPVWVPRVRRIGRALRPRVALTGEHRHGGRDED